MTYLSFMLRLYLVSAVIIFEEVVLHPSTSHLCLLGSSHFRSSPVKVLICCFGFLNPCKHLLQMQRKGERSLLFWHSLSLFPFSTTDSSVLFTSTHALPRFETAFTRVSVSNEDKYWSVGGGGGDQDHMQRKHLIYIFRVIGRFWIER